MGCPKLYENWRFVSAETTGRKRPYLFHPEKNRSRSAPAEMDDACPFLFSSEYLDSETGLVYYNYRYYSPELGRWTKRDPIEEDGGWNLYGFVFNNPNFWYDYLGNSPGLHSGPILYEDDENWYDFNTDSGEANGNPYSNLTTKWLTVSFGVGAEIAAYAGARIEVGVAISGNKCGGCFGVYFEIAIGSGGGAFAGGSVSVDWSDGPCCPLEREGTWSHYGVTSFAAGFEASGEVQVMVDFDNPSGFLPTDDNHLTGGGAGAGGGPGMGIIFTAGIGSIYWIKCWHWPWITHSD